MLQAARIVAEAGGMLALAERRADLAKLSRVNSGARGDVAIVRIGGEGGEHFGNLAGSILLDGSAALLSQAGLIMPRRDDIDIVAAWGV